MILVVPKNIVITENTKNQFNFLQKGENNMSERSYDKNFLNLLNELSKMDGQIVIEREDKSIFVRRIIDNNAYTLSADESKFDFVGEEIGFYDFPEFYQLLCTLKEPVIEQTEDSNKIVLKQNRSKINYVISDPESLVAPRHPGVEYDNVDAVLKLTKEEFQEIRKMASVLKAKYTQFTIKGNEVTVKCYNEGHDNSWDNTYELDSVDTEETITMKFFSETFTLFPMNDYTIYFNGEGLVDFKYKSEEVNLNLYIRPLED